ncbi:MAG TPA: hypothetical protein VL171_08890 [Verrucomicrobiae bacterium]|nr:hypothetical protein [Verrucomicrobiae bacterium]
MTDRTITSTALTQAEACGYMGQGEVARPLWMWCRLRRLQHAIAVTERGVLHGEKVFP